MAVEIIQIIEKVGTTVNELTVGLEFTVMPNTVFRVAKIAYCRKGYNKGNQGDWPAYKVEFEDTKLRKIIPEKNIEGIVVGVIEKKVKTPELPDEIDDLPEDPENVELPEIEVEMAPPEPLPTPDHITPYNKTMGM